MVPSLVVLFLFLVAAPAVRSVSLGGPVVVHDDSPGNGDDESTRSTSLSGGGGGGDGATPFSPSSQQTDSNKIYVDGKWLCTKVLPALARGAGSFCASDPLGSMIESGQCLSAAECVVDFSRGKASPGPTAQGEAQQGLNGDLSACAASPSCIARACSTIVGLPCYAPAMTPFHLSSLAPTVKVKYIKENSNSFLSESEEQSVQDNGIGPAIGGAWEPQSASERAEAGGNVGPAISERVSHVKSHPD